MVGDAVTNRQSWLMFVLTFAVALLLMTVSGPSEAQDGKNSRETDNGKAVSAMEAFLSAWLVHGSMVETMKYFGTSDASLSLAPTYVVEYGQFDPGVVDAPTRAAVPPGIAFGYWKLLEALWPDAARADTDLDDLLIVDGEIVAFLANEFDVQYVQETPFVVFVADERIEIDSFDAGFSEGGFGHVATVLKPNKKHPVLTMIADFRHEVSDNVGPLVTFWDEEWDDIGGEMDWRIQALGAFPVH